MLVSFFIIGLDIVFPIEKHILQEIQAISLDSIVEGVLINDNWASGNDDGSHSILFQIQRNLYHVIIEGD